MGSSHALAYHAIEDFEIVGLVARGGTSNEALNLRLGGGYSLFSDFAQAMRATQPDVVSINTYPDTHEEYTLRALRAGAHIPPV